MERGEEKLTFWKKGAIAPSSDLELLVLSGGITFIDNLKLID
jgi:hypothetical protein